MRLQSSLATTLMLLSIPFTYSLGQGLSITTDQVQEVVMPPDVNASALTSGDQLYVSVSVTVIPGPYGLEVYPSGGSQITPNNGASTKTGNTSTAPQPDHYNYPSIVFFISTTPLLTPRLSDDKHYASGKTIDGVNGFNDIEWMDNTFQLKAVDSEGKEITCGPTNTPHACIQIIGLLPGTTAVDLKAQPIANVADAASNVATVVAPVVPVVGTAIAASASGARVLFDLLFPPKSISYQYAYLDNSRRTFGWFIRPDLTAKTSALGTQTGMVMLQTDPTVAVIEVTGQGLSSWKSPPSRRHKKFLYTKIPDTKIPVHNHDIDYSSLQDLSLFPMLIPRPDALKILHISDDTQFNDLVKGSSPKIETTPNGYIIKGSLQKYLGLSGTASGSGPTPEPNGK